MTWLHLAETEIHLYMSYYPTDLFLSIFSAIYYLSIFSNVRMLIYVIAWQFYHKIQVLLEEKVSPVNEYFFKHHTSAPSAKILGLKCKDYDCKMCWRWLPNYRE